MKHFYRKLILVYIAGSLLLVTLVSGLGYYQKLRQTETNLQSYAALLALSLQPKLELSSVEQLNRRLLDFQYHAFIPVTAIGIYQITGEQIASSGLTSLLPLPLSETVHKQFTLVKEASYFKAVQPLYRQPQLIEHFGSMQTPEAYLVVVAEQDGLSAQNWQLSALVWLVYSVIFLTLLILLRHKLRLRSRQLKAILNTHASVEHPVEKLAAFKLPADLQALQLRLQDNAELFQQQEQKHQHQQLHLTELNASLAQLESQQKAAASKHTQLREDISIWLNNYQLLWQRQQQFSSPKFHALLYLYYQYGHYYFTESSPASESVSLNMWMAEHIPQLNTLLPSVISIDWLENAKNSEFQLVLDQASLLAMLQALLLLALRSDNLTRIMLRIAVKAEPVTQLSIALSCDGSGLSGQLKKQLEHPGAYWQWCDVDYAFLNLIAVKYQASFKVQSIEGLGLSLNFTLPVVAREQNALAKMGHLLIFDQDAERLAERQEALSGQAFQITVSQCLNSLKQKLEYLAPDLLVLMLPNQAPQADWLEFIQFYQQRLSIQIFVPPLFLAQWQAFFVCRSSSEFCIQFLQDLPLLVREKKLIKKLLVVDDNETNQAFIGVLLQHTAIALHTALTGNEVLSLCQQQQFDMILLDICLPDISGVEVARQLRQLSGYQEIPILAFTAHALPSEIAEFKQAGMNDILLKPLDPDKFETLLARYQLY